MASAEQAAGAEVPAGQAEVAEAMRRAESGEEAWQQAALPLSDGG
jgi:hypothetical protein